MRYQKIKFYSINREENQYSYEKYNFADIPEEELPDAEEKLENSIFDRLFSPIGGGRFRYKCPVGNGGHFKRIFYCFKTENGKYGDKYFRTIEKMILINIQNQKILVWLKSQSYRIYARILMIIKFIFEKASLIVVVC